MIHGFRLLNFTSLVYSTWLLDHYFISDISYFRCWEASVLLYGADRCIDTLWHEKENCKCCQAGKARQWCRNIYSKTRTIRKAFHGVCQQDYCIASLTMNSLHLSKPVRYKINIHLIKGVISWTHYSIYYPIVPMFHDFQPCASEKIELDVWERHAKSSVYTNVLDIF